MARHVSVTVGHSDPPLGEPSSWASLDPGEAPEHGGLQEGWFPGEKSTPIVKYQVEGDWRRGSDGKLFRWYRVQFENGQELLNYAVSPTGRACGGELAGGPYLALVFLGLPLAVATAGTLVVVGLAKPWPAVAGAVIGAVGGTIVGVAVHELVSHAVYRCEAPGNLAWRYGALVWKASGTILCVMPALLTAAATVMLTRVTEHG
jgi:hypothetical protein